MPRLPAPPAWVSRDAWLIFLARGVHNFSAGMVMVVLAIYLDLRGFSLAQTGLLLTLGFAGAAVQSFAAGLVGDATGRRRMLVLFPLLTAGTGMALAFADSFALLGALSFLGGFGAGSGGSSPMLPMEQASLPSVVPPQRATEGFALYGIAGFVGTSLGALASGIPAGLEHVLGLDRETTLRSIFIAYGLLNVLVAVLYSRLSTRVEPQGVTKRWVNPLTLPSWRRIFTISGLFAVDAFAGGFLVQSLVSYWFFTEHGIHLAGLGLIFFASNVITAISLWVAAKVSRRIGLVNTMVFSHIPANLMLISIPFLPTAWLAILVWSARSFLSAMDVPTRQAFTMAVVAPEERSAMSSITNVSRSLGVASSPSVATALWSAASASVPFVACGVIKIGYDLTLWVLFRHVRPSPEPAPKSPTPPSSQWR